MFNSRIQNQSSSPLPVSSVPPESPSRATASTASPSRRASSSDAALEPLAHAPVRSAVAGHAQRGHALARLRLIGTAAPSPPPVNPWNMLLHGLKAGDAAAAYAGALAGAESPGPLPAPHRTVLRELKALRHSPAWQDVSARIRSHEGFEHLSLRGVSRMIEIAKSFGTSRSWVCEATTKGVFDAAFASTIFGSAERYASAIEADPELSQLRATPPSQWNARQREQAINALGRHVNDAFGVRSKVRYAGEQSVADEGSLMKTYDRSARVDVFDPAFRHGFLTLAEGVFHEAVHVRQHTQNFDADTLQLLKLSPNPATRYEATVGLIESMAYRSGLIAALSLIRRSDDGSFLAHVASQLEAVPQDPWVLLRTELAARTGQTLHGLIAMHDGRITTRGDTADVLQAIHEICSQGQHGNHGRLIAKALWGAWPDAAKMLGEDHRDANALKDFERTLDAACGGRLHMSGLQLLGRHGISEQMIRPAHEKGTLTTGLKLVAQVSTSLEMLRIRHALRFVLGEAGIRAYVTVLGLPPCAPDTAEPSSSGAPA
ncbi:MULTISPECIES: hypothetical protein [unclassified Burkholderia]|uniref:hypothetical protein n=1 Tax=unclassified Burkholderia TaxID=2613784 RepID=UPI00214FC950|nr:MULTISPECIES: hypothetical protein [unclassified Burkholderia]MCR4469779.1 hypothetical protein [Burkholderia sp. SCN-KJ]